MSGRVAAMLSYKAWRESAGRFIAGTVTLALVCTFIVFKADTGFAPRTYSEFIWGGYYSNLGPVLFTVFAIALGFGGLEYERVVRTAGFTLTLPVTRTGVVLTEFLIGFLEVCFLAVIPALVIPALSIFVGQRYPVWQALTFAAAFIPWGTLLFSASAAASAVVGARLTVIAVCLIAVPIYRAIAETALRRFPAANPFAMMSGFGMPNFDFHTKTWSCLLPVSSCLGLVVLSAMCVLGTVTVIARKDF